MEADSQNEMDKPEPGDLEEAAQLAFEKLLDRLQHLATNKTTGQTETESTGVDEFRALGRERLSELFAHLMDVHTSKPADRSWHGGRGGTPGREKRLTTLRDALRAFVEGEPLLLALEDPAASEARVMARRLRTYVLKCLTEKEQLEKELIAGKRPEFAAFWNPDRKSRQPVERQFVGKCAEYGLSAEEIAIVISIARVAHPDLGGDEPMIGLPKNNKGQERGYYFGEGLVRQVEDATSGETEHRGLSYLNDPRFVLAIKKQLASYRKDHPAPPGQ